MPAQISSSLNETYPATYAALQEAKDCARKSLAEKNSTSSETGTSSSVVHHHYHDHWGWGPMWTWSRPVYVVDSSSRSSRRENDYTWLAIPAAIVGLCVAYPLGQNYAALKDVNNSIDTLHDRRYEVASELENDPVLSKKMNDVFKKQSTLLKDVKDNKEAGLMHKTTMLAGAVLAFTGALANSGVALALGASAIVGSGALMLFRSGFNSFDTPIHAQQVQKATKAAEAILASRTPLDTTLIA